MRLFEILDARLPSPVIEHPVHLSLAPSFQRTWGSIYDARSAGTMPLPRLEYLVAAQPLETPTAWYAVDAILWPRCDAETSASARRLTSSYAAFQRQAHRCWLELFLAGAASRALLQLDRPTPSAAHAERRTTSKRLAAEQIRSVLRQCGAAKSRPTCTFDAGYDPVQLGMALAGLDVSALVRLRSGRCFYADPPPGPTGGRPQRHGSKLVCDDPTTWPKPTQEWSTTDAGYGQVRLQCWSGLHATPQIHAKRGTRQARPIVRGTLIRLEVERLPKPTKVPLPLWL